MDFLSLGSKKQKQKKNGLELGFRCEAPHLHVDETAVCVVQLTVIEVPLYVLNLDFYQDAMVSMASFNFLALCGHRRFMYRASDITRLHRMINGSQVFRKPAQLQGKRGGEKASKQ